jgi:hypothetical protein
MFGQSAFAQSPFASIWSSFAPAVVSLTGQELLIHASNINVTADANIQLTAQTVLTLYQGNLNAVSGVLLVGQELTSSINSLQVNGASQVTLNSQLATVLQGALAVSGKAQITLTGIPALINVNGVLVWGIIPTPDDPAWQAITDTSTNTWATIEATGTDTWTAIGATSNDTWQIIDATDNDTWSTIPN